MKKENEQIKDNDSDTLGESVDLLIEALDMDQSFLASYLLTTEQELARLRDKKTITVIVEDAAFRMGFKKDPTIDKPLEVRVFDLLNLLNIARTVPGFEDKHLSGLLESPILVSGGSIAPVKRYITTWPIDLLDIDKLKSFINDFVSN